MTDTVPERAAAFAALERVPLFAGVRPGDIAVERLGGLTNLNFKVTVPSGRYVLRLPGRGTDAYVDRRAEAQNTRIAAEVGVAPDLVFADPERGIMLLRFVEDAREMTDAEIGQRSGLTLIADALRRLHGAPQRFLIDFRPFGQLDRYLGILSASGVPLPEGFEPAVEAARTLQPALDLAPEACVPCHCDLLADNLLRQGARLFVVDFEFSGNTDPLWDLADLAGEAGLTAEQDLAFLTAYLGGEPPADAVARMVAWKSISLLVACGWALVQIANGNSSTDFDAYAALRLERSLAIQRSDRWRECLAALTPAAPASRYR